MVIMVHILLYLHRNFRVGLLFLKGRHLVPECKGREMVSRVFTSCYQVRKFVDLPDIKRD